jgi:hypothetical protein
MDATLYPKPDRRALNQVTVVRCPPCNRTTLHIIARLSTDTYLRCGTCGLVRPNAAQLVGQIWRRRADD